MEVSLPRPVRLAAALLLVATAAARAAEPAAAAAPPPDALARQLLELTGGGELGKQVMTQVVASLRGAHPGLPDAFWDEFIASVDPAELEDMVVPIYVENLSVEEMTAAIAFYESPAGRSLVKKLPAIVGESMAVGQQWGARLAEQVVERLAARQRETPDT